MVTKNKYTRPTLTGTLRLTKTFNTLGNYVRMHTTTAHIHTSTNSMAVARDL